ARMRQSSPTHISARSSDGCLLRALPLRRDHWTAGFAMSALRRLQSSAVRKWRSFTDGVAQGQIGPKRGPDSVCYQRERNAVIVSTWDRVVVRVFRTMGHAGL